MAVSTLVGVGRVAAWAAVIALLTMVTRVVGFGRTLDFAGTVGATDLGDIYQTANIVPNIVFEIFAGGTLSVVIVPLLAGAVAAGDRRGVGETVSALLTSTVALLVPLAVVVALCAGPIVGLLSGDAPPATVELGTRMLRVFAPQIPLYGVGAVLTGVLHSHGRYLWPVLAPLLSSLTVIGVYTAFAAVDGAGNGIGGLSPGGELLLSVGTTLGVAVLTLCLVVPVRRLGVPLRARLALPGPMRRRVAGIGGATVVAVAAQQVALAYVIGLANGGPDGALVVFGLAQTVFVLPWAVLVLPLCMPSFPLLVAAASTGDERGFDATLARTTRAVLLASGLGVAVLVGTAEPLGRLLSPVTASHPPAATLTVAILAFAPGLFGFALFALFTRALHAAGHARGAALGAVAGWSVTIVAGAVASTMTGAGDRVVVLAAASAVGMTALGGCLLAIVVRRRGGVALAGAGRALVVGLCGALVAAGAGRAVAAAPVAGWAESTVGGSVPAVTVVCAGMCAVVVFLAVVVSFERPEERRSQVRRMVAGLAATVSRWSRVGGGGR